ncbi:hypothetical protein MSAN_02066000 [Mycena sanguinolenta]|uniref:Integrase core domain-containing protein n=1 Tax=Mycena sanguinolenta TaxID=230812 RepID=A0A8H6XJK5_9AGAR|nr:hypothetical protein MSAN_02066000 [Mycena sanguinolenta]
MSSEVLENLRAAYQILKRNVTRTLRTQRGAEPQLNYQINEALQFFSAAEMHREAIPTEEFATVEQSITTMIDALNEARQQSSDPPTGSRLVVTAHTNTGGRPRIDIDPAFLSHALALRGPTHLQQVFHVSARTIRRRALEYGLVQPGQPVYRDVSQADGTIARTYTSTSAPVSSLTDEELDAFLTSILQIFPNFGRRMIKGRLQAAGHRVPRLIRFKIVIHAFVDGKSRYVTGIRVSNNNRAETVLLLFESAVAQHGLPSRVRGDHGTENILVAVMMEQERGAGRGSYIWGRSVNNTRIERLWYDVTHGFGYKWKSFFLDLEVNHHLNPSIDIHIWLLHHLFLDSINEDAQEWAEAWNSHDLQIRGERMRSPRDIFLFSMIQDGPRGLERFIDPPDEPVEDPSTYGIDWDVIDNPSLMRHHLMQNPQEWEDRNPFAPGIQDLSDVPCEPPQSVLSAEQIRYLDESLAAAVDTTSRSMHTVIAGGTEFHTL